MSIRVMTLAWAIKLPHADKIVLLALADNANDEGLCFPSIATLARKCGMYARNIFKVIDRLEHAGHVSRDQRAGRSTMYSVHPCPTDTPVLKTPLSNGHTTPVPRTPPPLSEGQGTPVLGTPITVIEPSIEPSSNRQRAAPKSHRCPGDFRLDLEYALKLLPDVDAAAEAERFKDFEFKTPHCDWQATWRNWVRTCRDKGQYARKGMAAAGMEAVKWQ